MSSYYDDASLMLLASGGAQKDGKVYSVKPTDGSGDFTFTRGSNLAATRVGPGPNFYIEKGRENLLLQSNQFDTTWVNSSASVTGGQSGYDGTSDAWLLSKTSGYANLNQSVSASGVQTISIYAKAGSVDWCLIQAIGGGNPYAYFNLGSGVVGSLGGGTIDSSIEAVGTNGWYRCQSTFNASISEVRFSPSDANSASGTSGNAYFQDSQLEIGLAATDYIPTTTTTGTAGILEDTPRFDYSGMVTCPSLLLEPSRSNALNFSEYYGDNNAWFKYGGSSVISNQAISPEGVQNASLLSSGTTTALYNVSGAGTASQAYTASIYVKKISFNTFRMGMTDDAIEEFSWYINLDTLATSAATVPTTWTNTSAYAEDVGNGWIRCWVTGTKGAAGNARIVIKGHTASQDFYIWGAQLEAGAYPTSYIPTYGTSVTRSAEQADTLEDSSLFNLAQGTLFFEGSALAEGTDRRISISDGTTSNYISIGYSRFTGNIIAEVFYNGVSQQPNWGATGITQTDNNKFALSWGDGTMRFYVNGVLKLTESVTSPVGLDILRFSAGNESLRMISNTKQVLVFNTALSNLDLAILTGATTYNTFAEMAVALNYTVYE